MLPSLYIHFPWCRQKCPYCDFNSYPCYSSVETTLVGTTLGLSLNYKDNPRVVPTSIKLPEEQYLNALLSDLELELARHEIKAIKSIFIGGGTPSLFSAESMTKLLTKLAPLHTNIEITLEANPGTIDQTKLLAFHAAGINRLSIGIQSFQDDKLTSLGRIHSALEAQQVIKFARNASFKNINLDLMFGLPKQTVNDALFDLQTAIDLSPEHMSWYQLTLEEETPFAKNPPTLPNEDELWEIQCRGAELLKQAGYEQYEVSAYCRNNQVCQHNLNYWLFGDYIGIGAGAHGKITKQYPSCRDKALPCLIDGELQIERYAKFAQPEKYMNSINRTAESRIIPAKELPLEFLLNALRLTNGFELKLFHQRTGLSPEIITKHLEQIKQSGFIEQIDNQIIPTEHGKNFLNECLIMING